MRPAHASTGPNGCQACTGLLQQVPATELWFRTENPSVWRALERALPGAVARRASTTLYVEVPVKGSGVAVIEAAAAALTADNREAVAVLWLIPGNDPEQAAREAPTLTAVHAQMRDHWLAHLIDERRYYMHFQPVVALSGQHVEAHEALVRGRHGGRELSGGEIMAAAVATNLGVPLDARTRVAAVEQFAGSGLAGKLFINFQPTAIYNPRYCLRTTFAAIERAAVAPQDIVFEVVESEDVGDLVHLKEIVDAYRAHGLGVALDDFGTGFSTKERLLLLQPDYVKIDKSLVREIATSTAAREGVASILRLAAENGCRVIAEGIETLAQRDALRSLGVELGQGYLWARPALRPQITWPS